MLPSPPVAGSTIQASYFQSVSAAILEQARLNKVAAWFAGGGAIVQAFHLFAQVIKLYPV
jgi:hypothetical protein